MNSKRKFEEINERCHEFKSKDNTEQTHKKQETTMSSIDMKNSSSHASMDSVESTKTVKEGDVEDGHSLYPFVDLDDGDKKRKSDEQNAP